MASDLQSMDFVNNTMSVAGWGKTEKVSASKVKLKVNVDGITNDECQQVYLEESRAIIDSQLCAGGKKGVDSWFVIHSMLLLHLLNCKIFAVVVILVDR